MNERNFETRLERWERRSNTGRIWAGLFLLIIGALLLARASGIYFPSWFFTWPMILVAIGVFSGIRHGFRGIGWLIPLMIGIAFLLNDVYGGTEVRRYIWPAALIAAGLVIILRPRRKSSRLYARMHQQEEGETPVDVRGDRSDMIDISAIFSGVKKKVLSKNFRGGDSVAFMGGTEIDLMQADFAGKVVIDCFNMFGGTKLLVPPDWDVQSDIVAIFGGVEDKRPPATKTDNSKVLFLDGTCIFGGVEIRSY